MAVDGGKIISHLELDTGRYTSAMAAAQAQAKRFADENATVGTKLQATLGIMSNVGRLATGAITLPVVGMAAAGGKAAIEFESAFAGVRKTVDATEKQYAVLNKSILEMGRVVPKTHSELAGIMESGGQLGVAQDKLEKFTRVIADLDVATNLTGEAGASMLAQYANVKQMDLDNIDRLGSVIVDLGNNTATTELDIVNMAQRLSGAAAILKLTDAQTMGLAATMSSLGINAEAGGSAMSRILSKMMQAVKGGGDELKIYAKTANMSADAFAAAFGADPLTALIAFIGGLNEINEAGGNVYETLEEVELGDIRITDSLLRMSGAQGQLEKNIALANKAWAENTALTKEAEQRYGTTESKIKLAQNSIREAGISIGNAFLPVIGDAAEGVANLANKFADLDQQQQRQIITGAGIAAGIGPAMLLLKGVIGLLSGPGGAIALMGLAGAAAYGMYAALDYKHDQSVLEKTKQLFGDIELSAEDVQRIIAEGFGEPVINTTKLTEAKDAATNAYSEFQKLNGELGEKVYSITVSGDAAGLATLPADVDALIAAANLSIEAGRINIQANLNQLFDPGEGESFRADVDAWTDGLKEQMADKGEELKNAIKDGLSGDGKPDPEDVERVIRLRAELDALVRQAMNIDIASKEDAFRVRAGMSDYSAQSILALEAERKRMQDEQQAAVESAFNEGIYKAAQMKNSGFYTQQQYDAEILRLKRAYGQKDTRILQRSLDLASQTYYDQVMGIFEPQMRAANTWVHKNQGRTAAEIAGDTTAMQELANINLSADSAKQFVESFKSIYEDLIKLQEITTAEGLQLPQNLQDMLTRYEQLKNFSERDYLTSGGDPKAEGNKDGQAYAQGYAEGKQTASTGIPTEDNTAQAAEQGKKEGQARVKAANQAAQSEASTVAEGLKAPEAEITDSYHRAGSLSVQAANEAAAAEPVTIADNLKAPEAEITAGFRQTGLMAVAGYINAIQSSVGRAESAGRQLGAATVRGLNQSLEIRSPSKKTEKSALDAVAGFVNPLKASGKTVLNAVRSVGSAAITGFQELSSSFSGNFNQAAQSAYNQGAVNELLNPAAKKPLATLNSMPLPADFYKNIGSVSQKTWEQAARVTGSKTAWPGGAGTNSGRGGGGSAGGGTDYAPPPPDYSWAIQQTLAKVDAERQRMTGVVAGYDAQHARMLDMAGPWRAYYDQSAIDKQVQAIQDKYQAMMDAEQKGFDALSEGERQARSQAHSQLMQQLRQSQQEEVDAIRQNYDLQRRLATDWLTAQADLMTQQFNQKQEAARAEDYADNVAELEKRIRQTRSARERRELTEELERMRRDEALRQDQLALQSAMQGFAALKNAVNQGVIGLGDLTGDRTLPASAFGAGLKHVQGVTADQLESVLTAIADRQAQQSGNTYTIDLSGAVIRDDSDIDRIVAAFEERNRSIQRDMSTWS